MSLLHSLKKREIHHHILPFRYTLTHTSEASHYFRARRFIADAYDFDVFFTLNQIYPPFNCRMTNEMNDYHNLIA